MNKGKRGLPRRLADDPRNVPLPSPEAPNIATDFRHVMENTSRGRGRPRRYQTKDELIDAIQEYFNSLIGPDGAYIKAPTMLGLGNYLGFRRRTWIGNYEDSPEFEEVISATKDIIDNWRLENLMVPSAGVHPNGIMFVMSHLDNMAKIYEELRSPADEGVIEGEATPALEDNRPNGAAAMIDDLWANKGGNND